MTAFLGFVNIALLLIVCLWHVYDAIRFVYFEEVDDYGDLP